MKLKIKSLQGSTFTIDAEAADTIASIKSKIESGHGHQAASQKLIYSGKVLTDADTVQSCGVSEKDFFVLMVSKPKAPKAAPAPAAAAPESASATPSAPAAAPVTAPAAASAEPATAAPASSSAAPPTSTATTAAVPASTGPPGTSQFLVGSALEEAVNSIVEMGFEKSEVQKAMRASFNNPERAVEYLMTGIPEHLSQPAAPPASASPAANPPPAANPAATPAAAAAPAPATPSAPAQAPGARAGNLFEAAAAAQAQGGAAGRGGAAGGGAGPGAGLGGLSGMGAESDGDGGTVLDLGNPAMVAQLRQLVQQNPAALNPLIQALAQSNPRLANAMAEDPEGVLNLLASEGSLGQGGEEGEEGLSLPAMDELNPEDRTAVEQIIAMGIPENKAIEAYLMCGRNVEMAVQYYFENPQDFDD